MKNLDNFNAKKEELLTNLSAAIKANDADAMKASLSDWQSFMLDSFESTKAEFEATADRTILAARGVRQLTVEETNFYENFIKSAKAQDDPAVTGVITNTMRELPKTVLTSVLDEIKQNHPLLAAIDFQNTEAAIKWVFNNQAAGQTATWDELNTAITTELKGKIDTLELTFCKLTAFMYATQDMLDLGPVWVDAYTRQTLAEGLAVGLEAAIVDGDGVKKPVGMTRNFTGNFNPSTGYARKSAVTVADFGVDTYASILDTLSTTRLGNKRDVASVILICNPSDYFTKVMPATTRFTEAGRYENNIFPFPTQVIRSTAVPANHAVIGIGKNYFMGIGASKGGKLEQDDSYKFLEDLRTYKIKLHGNGRPIDINSFVYLDITNVKPVLPVVKTVTDSEEDDG